MTVRKSKQKTTDEPQKRRPGRPRGKAPAETKSIAMLRETWDLVRDKAAEDGRSINKQLEHIIYERYNIDKSVLSERYKDRV